MNDMNWFVIAGGAFWIGAMCLGSYWFGRYEQWCEDRDRGKHET